jgi:phosphatidate cytidylyltransferase
LLRAFKHKFDAKTTSERQNVPFTLPNFAMTSSLKRIITALILLPIALWAIYSGGWIFVCLVALMGAIAIFELYGLFNNGNTYPLRIWGVLTGLVVILLPKLSTQFPQILWTELLLGLGILLLVLSLFRTKGRQTDNLGATVFGVFYPAIFIQYILRLREIHPDNQLSLMIILTVFFGVIATDTLAYYTGKSLGKHPLFPRISPAKTWEGLIGGILGCGAFVFFMTQYFLQPLQLQPLQIAILVLICSVGSQIGDLVESMLKRAVSAKDSGAILPGHGGILDRTDGLLFIAPIAYYFFKMVI